MTSRLSSGRSLTSCHARLASEIDAISRRSLAELQQYPWPGNVRELRNVIERAIVLAQGSTLKPAAPLITPGTPGAVGMRLIDRHIAHITSVLDSCEWRIRGDSGAAHRLGIKPTTLESRMAKLGIVRIARPQGNPFGVSSA